jgi:hypothetical protein
MATGYTAGVGDGDITDFNEFALKCARAMGVAIMMRDEPGGGPIDIDKCVCTSQVEYHEKELAEAKALAKKPKTDEEILAGFGAHVADGIKSRRENIAESGVKLKRYDAMLAKVRAWEPPTEEHVNFKKFMLEQLTSSIDHDCNTKYDLEAIETYESLTAERYLELERDCWDDVAYHEKHLAENKERNAERRAWIEALLESLGELETA